MFAFVATVIFSSEPSPPPSFTEQCAGSFLRAGLNFAQFELYDRWFDDNSSLTLAQAGTYNGARDIEEYVRFLSPNSPYISALGGLDLERSLLSVDAEKKTCVFMQMFHDRLQLSEMAGNALFEFSSMVKLEWRHGDQRVGKLAFFYAPSVIKYLVVDGLNLPTVSNFVCDVMKSSCPAVWAANELDSLGGCEEKLAALPLSEGDEVYFDGNTQSCRKFHAVFASTNADHCAHTSFKPMADPKGLFKCQESAQVPISAHFSNDELAAYEAFAAKTGFESDQHWRLSPCETNANCPKTGDRAESTRGTGKDNPKTDLYTNDATCSFAAPTERRLLFGALPQAGVCVPT